MCVCAHVCVCACVCVRAFVRACVYTWVCGMHVCHDWTNFCVELTCVV